MFKNPKNEPDFQHYIKSILNYPLQSKGIYISRENQSSNGEIDFLCTFTNHLSVPLAVCIEVKKAHHNNVDKGIKQLSVYLNGEQTIGGIYLIFWFKNNNFNEPINF